MTKNVLRGIRRARDRWGLITTVNRIIWNCAFRRQTASDMCRLQRRLGPTRLCTTRDVSAAYPSAAWEFRKTAIRFMNMPEGFRNNIVNSREFFRFITSGVLQGCPPMLRALETEIDDKGWHGRAPTPMMLAQRLWEMKRQSGDTHNSSSSWDKSCGLDVETPSVSNRASLDLLSTRSRKSETVSGSPVSTVVRFSTSCAKLNVWDSGSVQQQ